jgi:pectin methylesterase-like acyl-CoA thioesterase
MTPLGGTGGVPAADGGSPEPSGAGPVELAGGVIALFPRPEGQSVCPDPALRLEFDGTPRLGSSGAIRIRNSTSSSEVATIDPSADSARDTIGRTEFMLTAPVEIDGDTVIVRLPASGLEYGQRYQVTVDRGAIMGPSGPVEIGAGVWEFSTRPAPPSDLAKLRVDADGSGEFCSVQRAIDALPDASATPREIEIARGVYRGVIHFSRKQKLTLRGEDRKATILRGVNNDTMNGGTAKRALIGVDEAQDLVIENLTIHNQTPQGGSQAEALRLQRCERCVVRDADILSLQDTLLWSGQIYARNCYIEGNVDYIWGTGAAFFEECEIKTVGRGGYNVQARNDADGYGYVFVSSRLTSSSGVSGVVLARVDASAYPASHVAYIDCELGSHVTPEGWTVTGAGLSSSLRFWEYKSVTPAGTPVDTSRRLAASKQLSDAEAAMMRDPSIVLGGWQPPR